ncbi:3-dehydroquinate synthase [Pseudoflavonifractor sp. 524-17]|uniref:3-dehydroquinate synthase n=1 Tax=Pseudoflavonifractor sp. 524-17 TaxID=2304577 RepID=UPI001379D64E|nr:3-dehydroquinate synthase [Pseudoflavonifractor sp. 524-17]NCE65852.1 3-dehydroquinate synthase [Pseudoflavonifractor sp. 524-17]
MKHLTVNLPGRAYEIEIGRGLLSQAGARCRTVLPRAQRLFVVSDSNVAPLYLKQTADSLEAAGFQVGGGIVPAGENSKSAGQLSSLWEDMMKFGLTRTDAVVALGGGVVGDLAGFAAATALRGVDFVQIPTTLLAQVDSSVGGKVAIDLRAGKNLAGAFWQPKLVLMDPDVLSTLPEDNFSDGMAEVIKYGCILDRQFFDFLAARPNRERIMGDIEHVLYTCCDLKRRTVVEDERDTGVRMLLNFGHTLGHAYELAGGYERWTHGQAVAAGMVKAVELGLCLGITQDRWIATSLSAQLACFGLPLSIPCTGAEYAAAVGLDKKSAGQDISLILLEELGRAVIHRMDKRALLAMLN